MLVFAADDEELLLNHLVRVVRKLVPDADIRSFHNAEELLTALKSEHPNIVLLDVRMPGINGIELARQISAMHLRINIIFVTAYSDYYEDAMNLFASGYVTKPVTYEKIKEQFEHLRYPVKETLSSNNRIFVQTFGNFTIFVDGKPVVFRRERSQMLFAYLVHRRGSLTGKKELAAVLFGDGLYDANRQSYMSKLISDISKTLEAYGVSKLFEVTSLGLSLDTSLFDCDLYDLIAGKESAIRLYNGEYMEQYSFGELYKAELDRIVWGNREY